MSSPVLSKEELKQLVGNMIALNTMMKTKQAEIKKIKDAYTAISTKVKEYSRQEELKFIDHQGHQVHVYNHVREPSINASYLQDRLKEYFSDHKSTNADAETAAEYIMKKKKEKEGGTDTWSITLRKIRAKKPTKRKASESQENLVEEYDPKPDEIRIIKHAKSSPRVAL